MKTSAAKQAEGNRGSMYAYIKKISFKASKAVNACRFPTFDVTIPACHYSHNIIFQQAMHLNQSATITCSDQSNLLAEVVKSTCPCNTTPRSKIKDNSKD